MRLVHLAERIAPFWPATATARAAAELPVAQLGPDREMIVVAPAPVSDVRAFTSNQQFARRLEPLAVGDGPDAFEAVVLESTLTGTGIPLFLLVLPAGHADAPGFAAAARALLRTQPERPELLHLHGDTGLDVDSVREELDGLAVIQSVYQRAGEALLAVAVRDADEVVTPCGDLPGVDPAVNGSVLAGALREHTRLRVVAHGIDLNRWDPARDATLPAKLEVGDAAGKATCRKALQDQAGLAPRTDVPIVVVWSRGGPVGGLELVAAHLDEIRALDLQLVVLRPGAGPEEALAALTGPQIWQADAADGRTLRRVLAGADVVLLPDREAPLGQRALVATRYGLVPVARRVNAHRDRLVEYDALSNTGGAFLFDEPEDLELLAALGRMRRTWRDAESWAGMVRANSAMDAGWSRGVAQLNEIYRKALAR
jgi:glycosyltransferase involved in cell wall biosynthesis